MRLLLFNMAMDLDDPLLEFVVYWVRALAERADSVHVITMRAGRIDVPQNVRVYSVGKEKGYNEPRRAVEFYRHLFRILREDRIDVCFSHMIPIFTVLAGPVLKAKRIPIVTWYAHPTLTWTLKLAHHLSDRMVASVAAAYPYNHDKLTAIGQGIDTNVFSPGSRQTAELPPIVLCVSRLSAVKDHTTLLKAIGLLRQSWSQPFRLVIVGGPAASRDEAYVRALHRQVKDLALEKIVAFEPAVSRDRLAAWYRRCAVHVNMTPTGSGDKVVLEAMACGRLCVVANEGFKHTLGAYANRLLFRYGEPEDLAERLKWTLSLARDERARIGDYLRRKVVANHCLDGLAQTLMEIFTAAMTPKEAMGKIRQTLTPKVRK
jgi:glycosyltransferase involved in cell wall biosynthesis